MKKIRGMGLSICVLLLFFIFSAKGSHIRFDSMINMKDEASSLEMFVDELPDIPRLGGYILKDGVLKPGRLRIGMFETKWKFHRDLPASTVFAYGRSRETATVPGPTIEAIQGADTYVTWENHLPSRHILPWDPSLSVAKPKYGGIPTVVHLHGGIVEPASDGNSMAWFTAGFNETGPTWKTAKYHYVNVQHPGNLWYHDHALGLTRVNILAGLMGAYIIFNPTVEDPLNLPSGAEYDRSLLIFDKSFTKNGSIYMNSTGDDPMMHPQWQPEYFGDVIIVNGKAWPYLKVKRKKYRFRIVNASNSRFYRLALSNGMSMTQIGSDSAYLHRPVSVKDILLGCSEIADIIIDFSNVSTDGDGIILTNSAPSVYPDGKPVNKLTSKVMKFVIEKTEVSDSTEIPHKLVPYPRAKIKDSVLTRYIAFYMYMDMDMNMKKKMGMETSMGNGNGMGMGMGNGSGMGMGMMGLETGMLINAVPFDAPVTEIAKQGTSEIWHVINLSTESHPLHIHLALFVILNHTQLVNVDKFTDCMTKMNDSLKCDIDKYAKGKVIEPPPNEMGWKNVVKIDPGFMTTILVRFSLLDSHDSYPFNVSSVPGYVYHCHMLDHEDNEMMRPLKIVS